MMTWRQPLLNHNQDQDVIAYHPLSKKQHMILPSTKKLFCSCFGAQPSFLFQCYVPVLLSIIMSQTLRKIVQNGNHIRFRSKFVAFLNHELHSRPHTLRVIQSLICLPANEWRPYCFRCTRFTIFFFKMGQNWSHLNRRNNSERSCVALDLVFIRIS